MFLVVPKALQGALYSQLRVELTGPERCLVDLEGLFMADITGGQEGDPLWDHSDAIVVTLLRPERCRKRAEQTVTLTRLGQANPRAAHLGAGIIALDGPTEGY
jgi:hypothetical protein